MVLLTNPLADSSECAHAFWAEPPTIPLIGIILTHLCLMWCRIVWQSTMRMQGEATRLCGCHMTIALCDEKSLQLLSQKERSC